MSYNDTFSSERPDKGSGLLYKTVMSAIIISLMMFVGEIYAFQSDDLLSQYRHMNSSAIQYIDVEEKRENSYLVSLDVKEMRLADILEALTRQMKVGLSYDSEADLSHPVTMKAENVAFFDVLNQLIEGTGLEYLVSPNKNTLVIRSGKEEAEEWQQTVTGRVTDAQTGEALPGVNVIVMGSEEATGNIIGTQSNLDGDYSINVPEGLQTLAFTYIGYQRLEVGIDGRAEIDVQLQQDIQMLDDVVVVGYGTQDRASITGSIATVSGEVLNVRPVSNAATMLQGRIPGVRIVQNSGQPGAEGVSIQMRGRGTFSGAGSSPLVLIDGIEGELSTLNASDIEDVTVLKDAASAAIYGSRAANGVILITTKQGESGRLNYSYSNNVARHTPTRLFDLITDSAEYMELWNEARTNTGIGFDGSLYPQEIIDTYRNASDTNLYPNTDWLDIMFNPATVIKHDFNIGGGNERTRFYTSFGYIDQPGVLKGFEYDRYNMRLNVQSQLSESFEFGSNIALSKEQRVQPRQGAVDTFLATLSQAPTYSPTLPDGSGRYTFKAYPWESNNKNPVAIVENDVLQELERYNINTQVWAELYLIEGLKWHTKGAISGQFQDIKDWRPNVSQYDFHTGEYARSLDVGGEGLSRQDQKNIYMSLYTYLDYNTRIAEKHGVWVQGGYSQEYGEYNFLTGYRRGYLFNTLRELNTGSPDGQTTSGSTSEWALQSFFGRINYNFDERYILDFTARYDGSSRFSKDNRWGLFPSLSAAWIITEESFLKQSSNKWLNFLKLRASYGELGNQNIGLYPYQDMLAFTGNYSFDGNTLSPGVAQTSLSNPDISWETTTSANIGIDFTIFSSLSGVVDLYRKRVSGVLRNAQVNSLVGLSAPTINDGIIQDTGIELGLNYTHYMQEGFFNGMVLRLSGNASHFKNELIDYGSTDILSNTLREEGRPFDTYYMLDVIGIFQNEEEINNSPRQFNDNTQPGDLKYRDVNGDGIIDNNDRTTIDGQYPSLNYSFGADITWKSFDLSLFFQGEEGRKIYVTDWGLTPFVQGSPPTTIWRDRWTPDNRSTTMPRMYFGFDAPARYNRTSSYFLHDTSYLRLKNVTVGYTIPRNISEKFMIDNLRIYFSADNLLTWTNYPGLDPERGGSGLYLNYPQNRIVSLGININF